ncbi:DUF371 domain-containing protein [Methanoregula sp.]|uniref:DUF371 domain-containing protein n=1 Tax=Methanoregula sp. TaxID=2052170 RepID=UPI002C0D0FAC|nr:DUF371 domain-containing protein [Methanoregula sp.]HVP97226.1 DUF371 domain-containing protein [Methanoregula sp.]
MEAQEIIRCRGHPLVLGTHPTTFEVTCEEHLTENGNCIIGIAADKGCVGLSDHFRSLLCHNDAVLVTRLESGGVTAEVHAKGSDRLTLDHPTDLVWRRSTFACGRTIGISSDAVAATLPRELIARLRQGEEIVVTLTVTRPGQGS